MPGTGGERRFSAQIEGYRDRQFRFLVPPGAPPLATRILALLRDPTQARRMGEEGRLLVEREFGVEALRQSYDALYIGLVAEAGGKRARMAA